MKQCQYCGKSIEEGEFCPDHLADDIERSMRFLKSRKHEIQSELQYLTDVINHLHDYKNLVSK